VRPAVCIFQPTLCFKFANSSRQKSGVIFNGGSWWRKYGTHLETNCQTAPWLEKTYGYPITLNDYSALCTRSCHEPHTLYYGALRAGVLHGLVYQNHNRMKSFLKEPSYLNAPAFPRYVYETFKQFIHTIWFYLDKIFTRYVSSCLPSSLFIKSQKSKIVHD
jgi:hypothetical protein